jgi:Zinc dependent phospholipase C
MKRFRVKSVGLVVIIIVFIPISSFAYSVLTHEAIVDANWNTVFVPLIKQKFPDATSEELKRAHAFAYGGCVMPDLGYYPFGSKLFTNLIHYARSGDFVMELYEEAENINEFAFALGAICHYYADTYGHSIGVNRSVPLIYSKMKIKFGSVVTYADNKISHLRTEFSFDVLQTGAGNYAPQAYHDFIGFEVSKDLVEKAFRKIYGLEIKDLFGDFDRAIGSFRWSVKRLIPSVTQAAWRTKRRQIRKSNPTATRRNYVYRIRRQKYFSEFGRQRERSNVGTTLLTFFIRIAPKIGPLRILKFKVPGPEAEKIFMESFDSTVSHYQNEVLRISKGHTRLANIDWDTGKKTEEGEYSLADKTYSDWIIKLKEKEFKTVTPSVKKNILAFYKNRPADSATSTPQWKQTSAALQELNNGK